MQKRFKTHRQFKKWLSAATMATISAVYLIDQIGSLEITNSPQLLEKLLSEESFYLPKGHYLVEYDYSDDDETPEIDYSKMVMVSGMEVTTRRAGRVIGNLRHLIEALQNFQYCITSFDYHPAYRIAGLWVVEPTNPDELQQLKQVLSKHACGYAFNDGTKSINATNFIFNKDAFTPLPIGTTSLRQV